jgi:hypothetical protein
MRKLWMVLLVGLAVSLFLAGCGKAKEATDAVHNGGEAQNLVNGPEATSNSDQGNVQTQDGENSEQVTVKTTDANGNETTYSGGQPADLEKLDIAVYPGAKQAHSGNVTNAEMNIISAEYTSTDSFNKVAEFYKNKYKGGTTQEMTAKNSKTLSIHQGSDSNLKMIIISEQNGQTHVVLQHHFKQGTKSTEATRETKKPVQKPEEKPAQKPTPGPEATPARKPAQRPTEKPAHKPAQRPDEKPAQKPAEKPAR